jgi:hypothetical protein
VELLGPADVGNVRWPRVAWAGRSPERVVQVLLGLVWIGDGVLQLQPSMFGRDFVTGQLLPAAQGNPAVVAGSITAMGRFLEPHIALWNALFATIQLAIGVGLLVQRTVRPALAVSFAWSLGVWWFAEGFGGLLTGTASPLTGAPGAVLLYVLIGIAAWPRCARDRDRGVGSGVGLFGARGARGVWALLWVGSAALLLQPANLAGGALRSALVAAEGGQPRWYAWILARAADAVGRHGTVLTLAVAVEMLVVGAGVALGWRSAGVLGAAIVVATAIWVFPEGLGGILTGRGTDPNTGPLLALAGLAWYRSRPEPGSDEMVVTPADVAVAA